MLAKPAPLVLRWALSQQRHQGQSPRTASGQHWLDGCDGPRADLSLYPCEVCVPAGLSWDQPELTRVASVATSISVPSRHHPPPHIPQPHGFQVLHKAAPFQSCPQENGSWNRGGGDRENSAGRQRAPGQGDGTVPHSIGVSGREGGSGSEESAPWGWCPEGSSQLL